MQKLTPSGSSWPPAESAIRDESGRPESRAEGCGDEYNQVDYAFTKLIYPYIDQAQVKKVQPKKLIRPVQQ